MSTQSIPKRAKARFDSPSQEAYLHLWRTYDRLKQMEDELFLRYGLTAQQYNTLRLLKARHPLPIATLALAGQLVSRAPDITRLIDKLVDRTLVFRDRAPNDRRTVYVGITEGGLELLDDLSAHVADCHERQLGHMSADEITALTALLCKARAPHEQTDSHWGQITTETAAESHYHFQERQSNVR